MGCYWANFAATGNPNNGTSGCQATLNLPEWLPEAGVGNAVVLGNSSISTTTSLKEEQCDLFAKFP